VEGAARCRFPGDATRSGVKRTFAARVTHPGDADTISQTPHNLPLSSTPPRFPWKPL
jgi:hypothetical protein